MSRGISPRPSASPPRSGGAITARLLAGNSARERIQHALAEQHLRAAGKLTDRQRDSAEWAHVQFALGLVLNEQGRYPDALAVFREIVQEQTRVLGPRHRDVLLSRLWLGIALREDGHYELAERELREVVALNQAVQGREHADTLKSRNNLANALYAQDKNAEAEQENREVLAIRERVLGKDHPDVFQSAGNLALALESQGRLEEALVFAQRAEEGRKRVFGEEHPDSQEARKLREKIAAALAKEKTNGPASGTEVGK